MATNFEFGRCDRRTALGVKTEGGQGDMRLVEFKADDNTVIVRTYSPVLDRYDRQPDQDSSCR